MNVTHHIEMLAVMADMHADEAKKLQAEGKRIEATHEIGVARGMIDSSRYMLDALKED